MLSVCLVAMRRNPFDLVFDLADDIRDDSVILHKHAFRMQAFGIEEGNSPPLCIAM